MPRKRLPRIRICEWCDHLIGPDRGPAAKTCSKECERDRNNHREKERYQRVKNTPEWQEVRADYLTRLRARMAADPAFAAALRERHRQALRRFRDRLMADPVRYEAYAAKKRAWFQALSPERREDKRARNREWYASLDPEQKALYLLQLRMQRAERRLQEMDAKNDGK